MSCGASSAGPPFTPLDREQGLVSPWLPGGWCRCSVTCTRSCASTRQRLRDAGGRGGALRPDAAHGPAVAGGVLVPGAISAEAAFALHDTYGFPFELTAEIAAEHGKAVDEDGFARLMEEQRERARAARQGRLRDVRARPRLPQRVRRLEQLDVQTQIGALTGRRRVAQPGAARVAFLPGGRRPGRRHRIIERTAVGRRSSR